jgi:hypothetical protein
MIVFVAFEADLVCRFLVRGPNVASPSGESEILAELA